MPEQSTTPDLAVLVQRFGDAFKPRDVDRVMSFYAPDAVLTTENLGAFEGRAAIRGFWQDWLGAYEDFEAEVEEIRDLGGGVAFAVVAQRGRPPGSTGWVQFRSAVIVIWANGLIEWSRFSTDVDEARAAAERLAEERG